MAYSRRVCILKSVEHKSMTPVNPKIKLEEFKIEKTWRLKQRPGRFFLSALLPHRHVDKYTAEVGSSVVCVCTNEHATCGSDRVERG